MEGKLPGIRKDLECFPVFHEGRQFVLFRDPLGLVPEGTSVPLSLYRFMSLLDGTKSLRDLQTDLMRQQGGVLVGSDEVMGLLARLDKSYILDSPRFREARDRIIEEFRSKPVRPCSHCGAAYPAEGPTLMQTLEEILNSGPSSEAIQGKVLALAAPHIDLSVGRNGYGTAYRTLRGREYPRVVVLGVGHRMEDGMFAITEKDFETPLGKTETDRILVQDLRHAGAEILADSDIAHRSEHSIEFQLLFLQYLLGAGAFKLVPILCGSLLAGLPSYSRQAYLDRAGPFLDRLRKAFSGPGGQTLFIAGVDLSHVGPKFGHDAPAPALQKEAGEHDRALLEAFCMLDADRLWEESSRVQDRFNVCGFSVMACFCEILPPCKGRLLHYETWNEEATRSSVSFGAVLFEAG